MKKILVIDDNPDILKVVEATLRKAQLDVVMAMDGIGGLSKIGIEKPDLVLVDIKMPHIDGWTFLKRIRSIKGLKEIPVMVMSSYNNMKDLFAPEGIVGYFVKPIDPEELVRKIKNVLG
jgi:CheY-like chemotaxis protein